MSLLAPPGRLDLLGHKGPRVQLVIRAPRTSKFHRPVLQVMDTFRHTWQDGVAPEPRVPGLTVACRTRLPGGFRRDKSFRPWVMDRGMLIRSSLDPVVPPALRALRAARAPPALLDKAANRQTRLRAVNKTRRSQRLLGLLPTRSL
jgi:hypothetical protein